MQRVCVRAIALSFGMDDKPPNTNKKPPTSTLSIVFFFHFSFFYSTKSRLSLMAVSHVVHEKCAKDVEKKKLQ